MQERLEVRLHRFRQHRHVGKFEADHLVRQQWLAEGDALLRVHVCIVEADAAQAQTLSCDDEALVVEVWTRERCSALWKDENDGGSDERGLVDAPAYSTGPF